MTSLSWQIGTLIFSDMVAINVMSLVFSLSDWTKHIAGQHYDIRLSAEGGYQAERSYSIASPPEREGVVELGIEYLADGEVSPFLYGLSIGDQIEMRGPIGGHFIWDTHDPGPLILIGGGSGMVPLMSILRHFVIQQDRREVVFLISAQGEGYVLFKSELDEIAATHPHIHIIYAYTQEIPHGWTGHTGRLHKGILEETIGSYLSKNPRIYICGSTPFVEFIANTMVDIGFDPLLVKTERFGGNENRDDRT